MSAIKDLFPRKIPALLTGRLAFAYLNGKPYK
jgi:hypothetical protein